VNYSAKIIKLQAMPSNNFAMTSELRKMIPHEGTFQNYFAGNCACIFKDPSKQK
jgi:hypothetical protein